MGKVVVSDHIVSLGDQLDESIQIECFSYGFSFRGGIDDHFGEGYKLIDVVTHDGELDLVEVIQRHEQLWCLDLDQFETGKRWLCHIDLILLFEGFEVSCLFVMFLGL